MLGAPSLLGAPLFAVLVATLLVGPTPSGATAPLGAAPSAPHAVATPPAPSLPTSTLPSSAAVAPGTLGSVGPASSAPTVASGRGHFGAVSAGPRASLAPLPSKAAASPYSWSSAFIGYGPSDPASLLFGEGTGMVSYNALDEVVFFGGQGLGGLSGVTLIYNWWYNASDPYNSTEGWNYTRSPVSPEARTNMSFGADQSAGEALLFGGLTDLTGQTTTNDSWLYNFATDRWSNVTARGGPPDRESAAFAVDQTDGIALLFGGIAPTYTSGTSGGAVIWSDTWEFHFATSSWTEVATPAGTGPSPRFGASMVWDPTANAFFMVGGCALRCVMDTWRFDPSTSSWSGVNMTGHVPPARLGASFAWDPGADQAVLFGGSSFDQNGSSVVYGDSYLFLPTGEWIAYTVPAGGPATIYQPGPEFDAATTWANFPGCNVMWVMGGNGALQAITSMAYVIQPTNDSPLFQCWYWFSEPGPYNAPPPECSQTSELIVTVANAFTQVGIPGAIVSVSGHCAPVIGHTGPYGSVQLTLATPDNLTINVSANGFHGNSTWYNYTYGNSTTNTTEVQIRSITVLLLPFPAINVQVLGNEGGVFLSPVFNAAVFLDNSSEIGPTDVYGWSNDSSVSEFNQSVVVSASAVNFSTAWRSVLVPYTGEVNVTLVLQADGHLTVIVLDERTHKPVSHATGTVIRLDQGLPGPFQYAVDHAGRFTTQLPLGNYSATAGAPGYLANRTGGAAFLPWVYNATIVVDLLLDYGTNISVRLRNAVTGAPIGGGLVTFGSVIELPTNPAGFANASDLGPPGEMKIVGIASGFYENSTIVRLDYDLTLPPLTLNLTPDCALGGCPGSGGPSGPGVSSLLPGGVALVLLSAAPALFAILGALYALGLATRRPRRALSAGQRAVGPGGPVEREGSPYR